MPESRESTTENLDEKSRFYAAVDKGIAAAERGEFIEEEEMTLALKPGSNLNLHLLRSSAIDSQANPVSRIHL